MPTRYDLRLTPDLTTFTFDGEETIAVTLRHALEDAGHQVLLAPDTRTALQYHSLEGRTTASHCEAKYEAAPMRIDATRIFFISLPPFAT